MIRTLVSAAAVCITSWLGFLVGTGNVGLQRSVSIGPLTLIEHPARAASRLTAVMRPLFVLLVLTACSGVQPSPPASTDSVEWARCEGDEWSVLYPSEWVVHEADEARDLAACALFAREPFQAEPEDDWGWSGAQIVLGLKSGCRGSFEVSTSEDEIEIDGFPAWRRALRDGHPDDGPPTAYEYFINLSPGEECEVGRWFYGRTEADDPGDFEENRAILDAMMGTLSLRKAD